MQLFIDECISPTIVDVLNASGEHYADCPRNLAKLGMSDADVVAICVQRNFIIVTMNANDFRGLIKCEEIHPGLIILPCVARQKSASLLDQVISHISALGDPHDVMINKVVEIDVAGVIEMYDLPEN